MFEKIPQNDNPDLPVVSVIVTFYKGGSYDNLFRSVSQKASEGGQVVVYSASLDVVDEIYKYLTQEVVDFNNPPQPAEQHSEPVKEDGYHSQLIKQMMKEIKDLEPDCVLFNFECCSL